MTDEIFVPPEAYDTKPWWTQQPNTDRIEEILKFILATSKPYLWPGQTYTRPQRDSPIEYLAEFRLPASKPLAPCPCCTPRHPKYRHGMIAYFPAEHVIRIMGHNCFQSINSEKHVEALKKYHGEIRRKQDIAYLLAHLDKVPELMRAIEHAAPIGHALDRLRYATRDVFRQFLRLDLWDLIRTGELRITTMRKQVFQRPGQGEDERNFEITETYGRISGYNFLKPHSQRLGLKLDNTFIALQHLNYGAQFKQTIANMADNDRSEAARLLGKAVSAATTVFAEINDLRQFTSVPTLATLNGWARIAECPVHMHISFDGSSIHIGKSEYNSRRIEVPPAYNLVLKKLPSISAKIAAA